MTPADTLTAREKNILDLLVEGMTNREIGERLGTTRFMILNLLRPIYEKSGQSSRLELAVWWLARTEGSLVGQVSVSRESNCWPRSRLQMQTSDG